MLINIIKTQEGSIKLSGNVKYSVKERFYNIVMAMHNLFTTLV